MFKKAIDLHTSNLPESAQDEIKQVMVDMCLGQDSWFIHFIGEDEEDGHDMPELDKFLKQNGCKDGELITILCWW